MPAPYSEINPKERTPKMSNEICKTVKIMPSHKSQGAFVEINESDFDAQKHKLYKGGEIAPPQPVAVDAVPAPEAFATKEAAELAADAGIDLASVIGTGKNGKVTAKDVEKAIEDLTAPLTGQGAE